MMGVTSLNIFLYRDDLSAINKIFPAFIVFRQEYR